MGSQFALYVFQRKGHVYSLDQFSSKRPCVLPSYPCFHFAISSQIYPNSNCISFVTLCQIKKTFKGITDLSRRNQLPTISMQQKKAHIPDCAYGLLIRDFYNLNLRNLFHLCFLCLRLPPQQYATRVDKRDRLLNSCQCTVLYFY